MKCGNCGAETETIICENCGTDIVEAIKQDCERKEYENRILIKDFRKNIYILACVVGFFVSLFLMERSGTLDPFSWLTFGMSLVASLFCAIVFGGLALLVVTALTNKELRPHKHKSKWFEAVAFTLILVGLFCYLYIPWERFL